MDSLPGEAVRNYLGLMTDQVARVEYLLRSLKSFNLFETQDLQNVEVPAFIDNFLPLVKQDYAKKGIDLSVSAAPDAAWVRADPQALQQALLNILTNAADAVTGRENPKVSINVERLDGMVRIQVKDNGCGIPEGKLGDIFRPFYTTKAHGTGLGLVLVKKMLARMNGAISIESREDAGTVVDIAIPEGTHGTTEGK
jgi:C4-dicarboxylate-specific signal transduction histidine kinase